MAAQFKETKGPCARLLWAWTKRAMTSLPTPLSPLMSTLASAGATRRASSTTSRMAGSAPMSPTFSPLAAAIIAAMRSSSGGSGKNSAAPARIAWTAVRASVPMP